MEEFRVKQLSLRALELNGVSLDLNSWIFLTLLLLCDKQRNPPKEACACLESGTEFTGGVHTRVSQRGTFFTF